MIEFLRNLTGYSPACLIYAGSRYHWISPIWDIVWDPCHGFPPVSELAIVGHESGGVPEPIPMPLKYHDFGACFDCRRYFFGVMGAAKPKFCTI